MYVKNEDRRYRKLVEALKKLENIFPILVFCNTIQEVIRLSNQFSEDGVVTAVSLVIIMCDLFFFLLCTSKSCPESKILPIRIQFFCVANKTNEKI